MIQADTAARIMQRYEDDYDNFLDKLKAKRAQKKSDADKSKADAQKKVALAGQADKTVKEAEAHKGVHLMQKAKDLLAKNGGIEGVKGTAQNVLKYFKTDTPSDYEVGFGKTEDEKKEVDKILGMAPMVVYSTSVVIAIIVLYGISRLVNKNKNTPPPQPAIIPAA